MLQRKVEVKSARPRSASKIEIGPPAQIFDDPQTQRCRDFVGKILRH